MTSLIKVGSKMLRPVVKICRKAKVNKPEIFLAAGLTMMLGSLVWVAIESTKAPDIMNEDTNAINCLKNSKEEIESGKITTASVDGEEQEAYILTDEEKEMLLKDVNHEIWVERMNSIWHMTRLYIGPLILFLLGSGLITKGYKILRASNIFLAGALKSTEELFKFYRNNVIEAEGKEADLKYLRGMTGDTVEIGRISPDGNGGQLIETEKIPIIKDHENPWRFEYSPKYFRSATGDTEHDISHLKNVQDYFDHQYGGRKRHYKISMYEVLDYLDPIWEVLDPDGTREAFAREYGWGHSDNGDDFIDLGVYRAINEAAIRGASDIVYMEMNCDGRLSELKNMYRERYKS